MSKVLIGIAAVIALAGAVFAVVHFSRSANSPALTPQNGWVALKDAPGARDAGLVSTFGAWRLVCRGAGLGLNRRTQAPGNLPATSGARAPKRRCAIAVMMRNRGAKEWLNLRFLKNPAGDGTIVVLFYAHGHAGESYVTLPGKRGEEIDIRADKTIDSISTDRCIRGTCMATGQLTPSGLDSILSAHALVITLAATKSAKAAEALVPTDGLKAAFAALQRQPA